MANEILIGRTDDGENVYAEARIEISNPGEWHTVEHETVTDPVTLAFSGVVIRKGGSFGRDGDWRGAGQIVDDVKRIVTPLQGWSAEDVAKLVENWDKWHLNTMRAGCVHQPPESIVYQQGKYGREVNFDATPVCPVSGYRYGSEWLTEAVPADVLAWVRERFKIAD